MPLLEEILIRVIFVSTVRCLLAVSVPDGGGGCHRAIVSEVAVRVPPPVGGGPPVPRVILRHVPVILRLVPVILRPVPDILRPVPWVILRLVPVTNVVFWFSVSVPIIRPPPVIFWPHVSILVSVAIPRPFIPVVIVIAIRSNRSSFAFWSPIRGVSLSLHVIVKVAREPFVIITRKETRFNHSIFRNLHLGGRET